jgi:hypothetical protein
MNETSNVEERPRSDGLPILTEEEFNLLSLTYRQALDEYHEATSAIYECIRRRAMPTSEELDRKQLAQLALLETRRSFWKAVRRRERVMTGS